MNTLSAHTLHQSWRSWWGSDPASAGPWWLGLVWTFVFSCACAVVFTVIGFAMVGGGDGAWLRWDAWWHWYQRNLVIALCVGFIIHGLFALAECWLGAARVRQLTGWRRLAYFFVLPNLGVAIGWPVGAALAGTGAVTWRLLQDPKMLAINLVLIGLISLVFYAIFSAAARRLQAEKRAAEAQLRLLQGQIEPHFLFNTLANVSSLMDEDVGRAKRMLESFTDYLRASLGGLRRQDATLGGELDLVGHYLDLMKTRMEDRLQYTLHCDPNLRGVALPPFLLQPLVENALHHGLEPKVEGGHVQVIVVRDGDTLVLEVHDDGMGTDCARRRPGVGMALDNIRQRLQTQYGNAASLTLTPANPGMCARLQIPFSPQPIA